MYGPQPSYSFFMLFKATAHFISTFFGSNSFILYYAPDLCLRANINIRECPYNDQDTNKFLIFFLKKLNNLLWFIKNVFKFILIVANKYIFFKHLREFMRLIYATFILLLVLMTSAQCQQTAEDGVNKNQSDAMVQSKYANPWILAEAILLLFLFASVPIIWNMHKYYNHVAVIEGILKEKVPAGDKDLINIFAQCEMTGPSGFQGVGRVTLALTLCMIVGLGLVLIR